MIKILRDLTRCIAKPSCRSAAVVPQSALFLRQDPGNHILAPTLIQEPRRDVLSPRKMVEAPNVACYGKVGKPPVP